MARGNRNTVRLWNPAKPTAPRKRTGGGGTGVARRRAKRGMPVDYVFGPTKTDPQGHYPIYDEKHARNALARAAQGAKPRGGKPRQPTAWQKSRRTTPQAVQRRVVKAVRDAYPDMEVAGVRRNPLVQLQRNNPTSGEKSMPRTRRRGKRRTPPRIQTGPKKGQFRKRKSAKRRRRRRTTGALSYKTPQNNPPPRKRRRKRRARRRTSGALSYKTPTSNPPRRRPRRAARRRPRARRSYGQVTAPRRTRRSYRRSYGNPISASAPFGERMFYAAQTGLASAGLAYGLEWLLFTAFRAFPQTRGKVFLLDLARFAAAAVAIGMSRNARGPVMRDALQVGVPAIQGYHVMNDIAARMGILTLPAWAALNAVTVASPAAQQRISNDVTNAVNSGVGVVTMTESGPAPTRRMNRGTQGAGVVTMIDSPNSRMAGAIVA